MSAINKERHIDICDRHFICLHILLFLIIYLSTSFVVRYNVISNLLTIGLWLVVCFCLLVELENFSFQSIALFLFIFLSVGLQVLVGNDKLLVFCKFMFSILTVFLFVNKYDFALFKVAYSNIIFFICIISLLGLLLYNIFPALMDVSRFTNENNYTVSNLYIFNISDNYRNSGLFWEPGAFQIFINIAIIFELFKEKQNVVKLVIFVIADITTFSTTAYIALAIIFLVGIINVKQLKNSFKVAFALVTVGALVLFISFYDKLFGNVNSVFGKITYFLSGGKSESAETRFYSITQPLKIFIEHPFFGVGVERLSKFTYKYTKGMMTCTLVNWFACYGVLYGCVMLFSLVKFILLLTKNKINVVLLFILFFVITMSENMSNEAMFLMLLFYGVSSYSVNNNENS